MNLQIAALFTTAILTFLLGLFVLLGRRDKINIVYSIFALFASLWIVGVAFFIKEDNLNVALYIANAYYIAAAGIATFFLYFSMTFPSGKFKITSLRNTIIIIPLAILVLYLLTDKNFILSNVFVRGDYKDAVINFTNYSLYGIFFIIFVLISYYNLFKSAISGVFIDQGKKQLKIIILGTLIPYIWGMSFNLILPWLGDYRHIWIGPFSALIMVFSIAYAITKYQLFSIRVVATQMTVFILWAFLLARTIVATSSNEQIINGVLLTITIFVGILLIRSVLKEVRQREQLEVLSKELAAANEKLKELDRMKTEFLSLASHQLKSPLTSIKGYTSMLLENSFGKLEEKQSEAVNRVFQSSNHLIRVVEDLLNISKIEQGGMQYEMAPFNLENMVKEIVDELKINAETKGLKLSFDTDKKIGFIVRGDREKLRQVVLNLIDNAIKYTPQGSVRVRISKDDFGKKATVKISDTGAGMAPETKEKLFKKFGRGDEKKLYSSGSGLGLYLAKQIVEAHKGQIGAESPGGGKGSIFWVELDLMSTVSHWS